VVHPRQSVTTALNRQSNAENVFCPLSLGLRTNVAITLGVRSFRERKVYGWNAGEQKAVVF